MSFLIQMLRVFCTASSIMALSMIGFAQSADPSWLEDLTWQLAVENECKVDKYIKTHEGKVGGKLFYEARLKCEDGRILDAHRIEPQETFVIKACEIVVC